MLTLRTLRTSTRAASLAEYAVLAGVLSVSVIGSVLTLGGEAVQGTEAGTTAIQDAFYVAEAPQAPVPVAPPSGGAVESEGGSAEGAGAEAPPAPVVPAYPAVCYTGLETVWMWSSGGGTLPATTETKSLGDFQTGNLTREDCGIFTDPYWATYVSSGSFSSLGGALPMNTHAPAPLNMDSAYRLNGSGQGVEVEFHQLVMGLEFYINDLDGLAPTSALYDSRGRLIRPASPGYRDRVYIEGVAPDGSIVYPTTGGVGLSNGGGSFSGLANRNCGVSDSNCNASFSFSDAVVSVRIVKEDGGVFDVSNLKGWIARE